MKFQLLYYTKFNKRLNVRVFFTYLELLKFITNNIDKIVSMNISKIEVGGGEVICL